MSDLLHVEVLRAGAVVSNTWRRENPDVVPDLKGLKVSISERQFGRMQGGPIDLSRAQICRAELDQATLVEANLNGAVLTDADLSMRAWKMRICAVPTFAMRSRRTRLQWRTTRSS
jgi:hypothetical protein